MSEEIEDIIQEEIKQEEVKHLVNDVFLFLFCFVLRWELAVRETRL